MKILIIDLVHPVLAEKLRSDGFDTDYFPDIDGKQALEILPFYEGIILRSKIKLTKEILQKNRQLKFVARVGSGLENIDVQTAESLGIAVFNSPEGNRSAVGEHTLGMILSLFHKICFSNNQISRENLWLREENRGLELEGKTFAIIGYGNMGSAVAERLQGFGTNTIAYDKYKHNFSTSFVKEVSLQEVFETADIVSLHLPLTDETKFMVNAEFIAKFKKNFFLINTSRGQIVDTAALVNALKSGKISGAALDVLEYEKFNFSLSLGQSADFQYLKGAPNVILTPHIAGLTKESFFKLSLVIYEKIANFLKTKNYRK